MNEQKIHLSWPVWHTYTDHLKEMLHNMKTDETFADVTLVCDDGRKIRAHKVVLGESSPVMKNMLMRDSTSIIDLKGIALEEINSILQFIYLGEATLSEERMNEFIDVAQKLKVKELCGDSKMEFDMNDTNEYEVKNHKVSTKPYEKASTQSNLSNHIQTKHEGVKYACNQCDHQATTKSNISQHIKSKHDGIKYACNQCDHQATRSTHLKVHIQSVHEGVSMRVTSVTIKLQHKMV